MVISGPVRQNGGIENFTTGTAFPGIKRTYEIIVFFCKHSASAFRTFHVSLLLSEEQIELLVLALIRKYTRHASFRKKENLMLHRATLK